MPAVSISPYIRNQFFDDSGSPLAGGYLYTYEAGTSTNKATYSDATGETANANPVVLDSAGRCQLYLASGAYKFVLKDSDGSTIWTEDNVAANTITTEVDTVDDLKALTTTTTFVRTLGYSAVNDGGGWWYYWDSDSTDSDDGGMVIQPDSLPASGRWLGFMPSNRELNLRVYGAVCDGVSDDITELQACDTWCAANSCKILIDSSIYLASDPSLSSVVKLLPSAQFKYDYASFQPTFQVDININDNTQHFDVDNDMNHVPILSGVSDLLPEWFGETIASHPITSTCAEYSDLEERVIYATKIIPTYGSNTQLEVTANTYISSGGILVGSATGSFKGNGTINAEAVYDDNVLLTGYVLDKYFNPEYSLEEWKNKSPDPASNFDMRAPWIFDVDQYNDFIASRRMLPTFEDVESSGNIPSNGAMIQKLWEVVEIQSIHIKQLADRIISLEEFLK